MSCLIPCICVFTEFSFLFLLFACLFAIDFKFYCIVVMKENEILYLVIHVKELSMSHGLGPRTKQDRAVVKTFLRKA